MGAHHCNLTSRYLGILGVSRCHLTPGLTVGGVEVAEEEQGATVHCLIESGGLQMANKLALAMLILFILR